MSRLRTIVALALVLASQAAEARAGRRAKTPQPPAEAAVAAEPGDAPAGRLEVRFRAAPLVAANDGETVRVAIPPGSVTTLGGDPHELLNFHLHALPARAGGAAPELHLVHLGADERPLVVVVRLEQGPASAALGALLPRLPAEPGESRTYAHALFDPRALLPRRLAAAELPADDDAACAPGARRLRLSARTPASKAQLDALRRLLAPRPAPAPRRAARVPRG